MILGMSKQSPHIDSICKLHERLGVIHYGCTVKAAVYAFRLAVRIEPRLGLD
jgi:hypothetical protein